MPIPNSITAMEPELTIWRQDFHTHPELGYQEVRTAGTVADMLRSFGVDEVHEGIGKTGVVGVIHGTSGPALSEQEAVLLRADMDALPMAETTGLPYASQNAGVMHACGHDGHTTMLLGAARHLTTTRNFSGTVFVCFQPAEEGGAGAKAMIEDGLFERFPCRAVFGMHNWPGLTEGHLATRPGPLLAATDEFIFTLKGSGGHAAMPHLSRDPIVAGAALVQSLQTIVSRNISPVESAVVSVTKFTAGSAFNVIPGKAELVGTIRSFKQDIHALLKERMEEMGKQIGAAHGIDVTYEVPFEGYPPTVNHPDATAFALEAAAQLVGPERVQDDIAPTMGGEDFAYMAREKPGCFMLIGTGSGPSLHDSEFDFNDSIAPLGVAYWVQLAEAALPRR